MDDPTFLQKVIAIRRWFKHYKAQCRCAKCGTSENIEFHHIRDKNMKISAMVRRAVSIEQLKNELDKCIPLCNKCHKVEHKRLKDEQLHRAF